MRIRLLLGLLGFVLISNCLLAQETAYLPQLANGTFAGGSMRTTFILFNPQCYGWSDFVTLRLTDDAGQPMPVTIPGRGTASQFGPFRIGGGQTLILQTDGTGTLKTGAAKVERANGYAHVAAIFTLYDPDQSLVTEAGVGAPELLQDFVIPVDATGQFNTGVALFNPGDKDASITFILLRTDGTQAATLTQTLKAGEHLAKFVAGQGSLFPAIGSFQGSLSISSTEAISAITLRQNGSPLSNTTLPVVAKTGSIRSFNLPQVANGLDQSGLRMRTTFILFNISATTADITVTLLKQNGSAFPVTIPNGVANNTGTFTRSLPPGGAAFLQTDGSGPLTVGTAQVTSSVPIGVSGIFTLYKGTSFLTEAGVGDSREEYRLNIPVDISPSFDTGVAFFNRRNQPTTITTGLLNSSGQKVAESVPIVLPALNQTAKFVSELFPGQGTFQGSLAISASAGVSAITLRQNNSPIAYTTLPAGFRACTDETTATAKLAPMTRTSVTATSNTTLDMTLPAAFELSGFVRGDVQVVSRVTASTSGGQEYWGSINQQGKYYAVHVPAGTYTLKVCCTPGSATFPGGALRVPFTDPTPVQVDSDTTRDITVPAVTLSTVSGSVSGLNQFPADTEVYVQMMAGDSRTSSEALVGNDGSYLLQIPNGTYTASLIVLAPSIQQRELDFFNLKSLTVNGNQTSNLTVPAFSIVSGVATRTGATGMPAASSVSFSDNTAPAPGLSCSYVPIWSWGSIATSDGAYTLYVPNGRAQSMTTSFPVGEYGFVDFPWPGRQIPALAGNRAENLTVPALPGTVTISGKVTDPETKGVENVHVNASSEHITGAAGLLFESRAAITDSDGNYTLTVLSGTAYTLSFTPPEPRP